MGLGQGLGTCSLAVVVLMGFGDWRTRFEVWLGLEGSALYLVTAFGLTSSKTGLCWGEGVVLGLRPDRKQRGFKW